MTLSATRPIEPSALVTLADLLIPAGQDMPSASQADPTGEWTAHVLNIRPDLAAPVERAIHKCSRARTFADIDRALADDPVAFAALSVLVAGAYYLNPRIRRLIGYPGQVAQAPAEWPFGTEPLIQRVVARGPIYRPTPDSKKGGI